MSQLDFSTFLPLKGTLKENAETKKAHNGE